nr:Ppx/GppA phosphatase family protein [uncultured Cohaesibacter sp.]
MAQDDGDVPKGNRASAGLRRMRKGNRGSHNDRSAITHKDYAVPVGTIGERSENSGNFRSSQDTEQQGKSVQNGADETNGQQQGRKRRRSRSRRRKGDYPAQTIAKDSSSPALSEEKRAPNADSQKSANGKAVSNTDTSNALVPKAPPQHAQNHDKGETPVSSTPSRKEQEQHHRGHRYPRRKRRGHREDAGSENSKRRNEDARAERVDETKGYSSNKKHQANSPEHSNSQATAEIRHNGSPQQSSGRGANKAPVKSSEARTSTAQTYGGPTESYAALDLGTNNCRLLVAEPYGQSFRVIDAFSRIVRLGEGLSQSGRLSDEAQERAIAALRVCQSKLNYRAVKRFRLIATEACRRASNGAAFLNRVHRETGLRLEIVNRETEARLAVAGCASLVHPDADGVVLFDIGGGSSEIVWLDLDPMLEDPAVQPGEKRNRQTRRAMRHLSERIRCWASLQVGVVTLSEKYGGKVVTREHFEVMVEEVRQMLGDFEEREELTKAIKTKNIHMLGTSGTVTTLAGVHLGLERYDRRQVDGTWLTANELRDMIGRVLDMNFQERMNNPCIGADRADLVLAGCAILEAFHREWPCSQLRVADRGLREGILMELMIDDGVWNPHANQSGKRPAGSKKKRSRRRGSRGHRGGQGRSKPT